jgi:hypothetical protein
VSRIVDPKTTPVTSLQAHNRRQTLSGAHIRPLSEPDAKAFLDRNGAAMLPPVRIALGAFEDNRDLVGVLAVTGSTPGVGTVHVAITPERRRLKLATDLFQTFAADHLGPGWHLNICRAIDADIAQALQTWINPPPSRSQR